MHENHIFRTVVATHVVMDHWEVAVQGPTWASEPIIPFHSRPSLAQSVQRDFRLQDFPIAFSFTYNASHTSWVDSLVFIRLLYKDTQRPASCDSIVIRTLGAPLYTTRTSWLLATIFIPLLPFVTCYLGFGSARILWTLERRANSSQL